MRASPKPMPSCRSRPSRTPDPAAQPATVRGPPVPRPAAPGPHAAPRCRPASGRDVRGPGRLQAHQRLLRPCGGGRHPAQRRGAPAAAGPRERHGGPRGRRRIPAPAGKRERPGRLPRGGEPAAQFPGPAVRGGGQDRADRLLRRHRGVSGPRRARQARRERRRRHVCRQAGRRQRLCDVRVAHGLRRHGPAVASARPAAGDSPRRTVAALPAQDRRPARPHQRRGGPAALAASPAGQRQSGRVHSRGRALSGSSRSSATG